MGGHMHPPCFLEKGRAGMTLELPDAIINLVNKVLLAYKNKIY
jgi:hypothetical protein